MGARLVADDQSDALPGGDHAHAFASGGLLDAVAAEDLGHAAGAQGLVALLPAPGLVRLAEVLFAGRGGVFELAGGTEEETPGVAGAAAVRQHVRR